MSELKTDTSPADEPGLPSGSSFEVPTYDVAPEDQHYVDRVLAMDPIRDVPSPVEVKGRVVLPAKLTLAQLPPDMRESVERKLVMVPRHKYAEAQDEFVRQALESNSLNLRASMGVGANALPFHREQAQIAAEGRAAVREFDRLSDELAEVSHHETRFNEQTGKQEPVPVLLLQGERRAGTLRRMEELSYRLKLLDGIEGQRRMRRAMLETVELLKAREAQAADEAEIARLVDERERQSRIEARVATKLRMRGVEVKS